MSSSSVVIQAATPSGKYSDVTPVEHGAIRLAIGPDQRAQVHEATAVGQVVDVLDGYGAAQRVALADGAEVVAAVPANHRQQRRQRAGSLRQRERNRVSPVDESLAASRARIMVHRRDVEREPR